MHFIKKIWWLMFSPLQYAFDNLEHKTKLYAGLASNIDFIGRRIDFFQDLLENVDPTTNWWDNANFRQKIADFEDMLILDERKRERCQKEVERARLVYEAARFKKTGVDPVTPIGYDTYGKLE